MALLGHPRGMKVSAAAVGTATAEARGMTNLAWLGRFCRPRRISNLRVAFEASSSMREWPIIHYRPFRLLGYS